MFRALSKPEKSDPLLTQYGMIARVPEMETFVGKPPSREDSLVGGYAHPAKRSAVVTRKRITLACLNYEDNVPDMMRMHQGLFMRLRKT